MQIKDVLLEQTPPAAQPAAAPVAQPGAVKNVQQAATQTKGQQTQGMLNVQALKQLLPGVDGTKLTQAMAAVKSGAMTAAHYQILGMAFQQLVQADPATTVKVMNLLKKVQQEPVAEAGVMDYAKALFKPSAGTQGQTLAQRAGSEQAISMASQLGRELGNQWTKKSSQIRQAAAATNQPVDNKYLQSSLVDLINRVAFKGRMNQVDPAVKPQIDAAINSILTAGLDPTASKKAWDTMGLLASSASMPEKVKKKKNQAVAQPQAAATAQPAAQPQAAAPAQPVAPDAAQIIANLEKTVPKDVLMSVAAELLKKYTSRATPK
jgi:hypothetical protein